MRSIASRRLTGVLGVVTVLALGACGSTPAPPKRAVAVASPTATPAPVATVTTPVPATPEATPALPTPPPIAAVAKPGLPLRSAPINTPLVLVVPRVGLTAPVLAVGTNAKGEMDAPQGPPSSPIWDTAFWYRDGEMPGAAGVATIAGHVDDTRAQLRAFSAIRQLHPGDGIEVRDTRSGLTSHFHVTEARPYSLAEANTTTILNRIFGVGANTGRAEDKAADAASGIAHLNLITCTGTWVHGNFNQRFVVYAVRDH